jgi:hypothetical protein
MHVTRESSVLTRLVDKAAQFAARPSLVYFGTDGDELEALAAETQAVAAKPAPDGRLVGDAELILAQTLLAIARARGCGESALIFCQIAGVLLPVVRENAFRAIEQGLRPAPRGD